MLTGILAWTAGAVFLVWLAKKFLASYYFWDRLGVPNVKGYPLFGVCLPTVLGQENLPSIFSKIYREHPGLPYLGALQFTSPTLVVRDPEIIGKILIKDFSHFVDHGFNIDEEVNWIDANLVTMNGSRWRALRNKVLPAFTSGKLKGMYPIMAAVSEEMVKRLADLGGADVDAKDLISRFSTEIIASCAFGLDASRTDPKFRAMGAKSITFDPLRWLGFNLVFSIPGISKYIKVAITPMDVSQYFGDIIRQTFDYRTKNNVTRNDFVQLLLQLRDKGYVEMQTKDEDDAYLEHGLDQPITETFELTEKMLIAQAFTFLMAGFEATSSAVSICLSFLARNTRVQEKLRTEVVETVRKHGGFTYQALKEMTYLDMVLNESMRLYPLLGFLFRVVTKEYELGPGVVLPVGTQVVMPIQALHRDEDFWEAAEEFRPERFAPEEHRVPNTFLPFGDGPRVCIGMRFALMTMKQAIAATLQSYVLETSPKTTYPLKLRKRTLITTTDGPLYLRFIPVS